MFDNIKKIFSKTSVARFINTYREGVEWSDWNSEKAIKEGFESSAWVYACIKARMDAVASVPFIVETMTSEGWEEDKNHPLKKVLDRPNPEMSQNEFLKFMISHLDLDGNFYALKVKGGEGNKTQELYPVLPYDMKPYVCKGDKYVSKYYYTPNGNYILPENMFHSKYTNPDSFAIGACPLKSAGKAVDIDNSAGAFQKISMQQRGIPDGVFQVEGLDTQEQFQEVKKMVSEQYANIGTAREPYVLGNGKWVPMSRTAVEMDFMNTRNFSMKEICAVYRVPSEMINGMGDSNRSSSETVRKTFWLDTIIPVLDGIRGEFNMSLASEYGSSEEIRIAYDLSSVQALQDNLNETIANAKILFDMGVPFDLINQKLDLGFDSFTGSDISYIQSSLLPSDTDVDVIAEEKNYREIVETK
jgi:HK97 family phage portal protein